MSILSLGGRRLTVSIRIERVPENGDSRAEQAYLNRQARAAALAERSRWELEHLSRAGRVY